LIILIIIGEAYKLWRNMQNHALYTWISITYIQFDILIFIQEIFAFES
jgi:hypothetical protein